MIDDKEAVRLAKQKAAEMLYPGIGNLEEIERESYKDRDVWSITLSFPRDPNQVSPLAQLATDMLQYKRFLIDAETGELLAMKLRELSSR
jgi:hypothetical protein